MEIKRKDILICGFALFAIFFGAGNLIFPPYLGVMAGDRWYVAMLAFILSDPLLPILGVIVTASLGGRADDLGKRVSPKFSKTIGMIAILVIGPLFAIPRTGATTHEIFVKPLFANVPIWLTCLVFFGLTLYITFNPGKVIDFIGKYLTPLLLLLLGLIVVVSIMNPPFEKTTTAVPGLFMRGFSEGYQTMDALSAALMTGIVISDLARRGYKDKAVQFRASILVGMVAFILLALVYGGLTYAGATVGAKYNVHVNGKIDVERTVLLIDMVEMLLGNFGKILMGVATALACLTTSTGLVSMCGNYFETISNGKMEYKYIAYVCIAVSFVISQVGVDRLISIAVPILSAIYPVIIVLIFMSIFDKKIKYNWTYTGAVIGTFFVSLTQSLHMILESRNIFRLQGIVDMIKALPLGQYGFEWFVPAMAGAMIFTMLSIATQKGKVLGDALE